MRLLKRRWFIRSMIVGVGGVAIAVYRVPQRLRRTVARWQDDLIGPCLPELFQAAEVERIGAHYLATVPHERDRALLAQLVFASLTNKEVPDPAASEDRSLVCAYRLAELNRAIERDFRAGDLILLADWQLTRTEARLCALSNLSSP